MCCSARAKAIKLRHDVLLQASRRIAHRAGVSTAGEPAMDRFRNTAPTNREVRGDILAVLPSGLVVADVSIVHPAAPSYSRAAAWTAGAAATSRNALKRRQYHAGGLPAAPSFPPLSAVQFLNALAEAALASSAAGTDVTKAAFISGALPELGATLCMGNKPVCREGLHVYAAAGGARARMGMHVPTADVT
jgi:hypothetical protein